MPHCKECEQPCLLAYGDTCRNCHEMLEARRLRQWDRWDLERDDNVDCVSKKRPKLRGLAHPSMDSAPRHKKEEVDG